ncbi:MAG: ligase-associated DNA damage response endonuclease PdeM [Rubrivivax sp.]|nr:ligase-associated DNA damage response endonuclease PdeM [Rubrivivax sp.]
MVEIELAGMRLQLRPEGCAYLPDARALLVADAHLGKAHSFRRLGVPVPEGPTDETLDRLSAAVQATGARQVVFLGDLLHSRHAQEAAAVAPVTRWRLQHTALDLLLVRGNHDRHAGDPPADWRVRAVDEPYTLGTLHLQHHPAAPAPGCYALAGHLHPAVRLGGRGGDRLRLPCFHFGQQTGVLPAFGSFTGGHLVQRRPGDRVFALADGRVVELPGAPG